MFVQCFMKTGFVVKVNDLKLIFLKEIHYSRSYVKVSSNFFCNQTLNEEITDCKHLSRWIGHY